MAHNWYAHCAKCGKVQEKKIMRRLFYNIGQYGTDLCEKMNNPDFIKFMDERNGKDGT